MFVGQAEALITAWRREMAPLLASDAPEIRVERLCAEITKALPDDGILVADTELFRHLDWYVRGAERAGPDVSLRAAGSLGWSFPAALGAKLAAPQRKVICFSGDGAFYYHLAELETARRRGIATVTVINNNSGFGQGWPNLLRMQGNTPGHPEELLRFGPTDFAAVARSFGVHGIRVEDPAQIAPALAEALSMDAPVVVDVVTDIDVRAPAPWLPEGRIIMKVAVFGAGLDGTRARAGARVGRGTCGADDRHQCRNFGARAGPDGHWRWRRCVRRRG